VDGRPECLSSFTHSRPSLKRLNQSNVLAWLKACSPKASFSIRWVSGAVLLSLKRNLMQVLCSLTPAISINANTRRNGVKKTAKTQKHVHLQRSQLPDCWSKDTKKRHLAAQVRSANGLRGIFKFSEILGRLT